MLLRFLFLFISDSIFLSPSLMCEQNFLLLTCFLFSSFTFFSIVFFFFCFGCFFLLPYAACQIPLLNINEQIFYETESKKKKKSKRKFFLILVGIFLLASYFVQFMKEFFYFVFLHQAVFGWAWFGCFGRDIFMTIDMNGFWGLDF